MHFFRPRKRDELIGFLKQNGWHVRTLYDAVKVTKDLKRIVVDATADNWKTNVASFVERGLEVFLLTDEEMTNEELSETSIFGLLTANDQFCSQYVALVQRGRVNIPDSNTNRDLSPRSSIPLSQRFKKETEVSDCEPATSGSAIAEKVIAIVQETQEHAQMIDDPVHEDVQTSDFKQPLPSIITVYGAKGGVGKTVFLLNLASILSQYGIKVCLLDLDLYQGTVASTLHIHPERTITDLVRQIHDSTLRQTCLLQSGMGFSFVAAPTSYMDTSGITVETLTEVIGFLKTEVDIVLIDTSPFFDDVVQVAMEHSDQVMLMTTDEPSSIKNLRKMMKQLDQASNPQCVTVLNRVTGNGVNNLELAQFLPWPLLFTLPEDIQVSHAAKRGKCFTKEQASSAYVNQLEQLVQGWYGEMWKGSKASQSQFGQLQKQLRRWLKGGEE